MKLLVLSDSLKCCDVQCLDENHSFERDSLVIDILIKIVESSYETLPLSKHSNDGKKKAKLPQWNEIKQLRQDSLFWHALWVSAHPTPRPKKGDLYNVMRFTRRKYHHAI